MYSVHVRRLLHEHCPCPPRLRPMPALLSCIQCILTFPAVAESAYTGKARPCLFICNIVLLVMAVTRSC